MANNLTGDYEAVVQISARLIHGLLAALHQNGANADAPLKLPHSANMRLGDPPKSPELELRGDFRNWLRGFQKSGNHQGVDKLSATALPGAARMIESALSQFGKIEPPKKSPGIVRGKVKVQLSTPTISVQNGSTSEVTLHVDVRAHFYPDAGTAELGAPEHPVHGEVQTTFDIRHQGGRLVIQPSSQDARIQFIAAQGTNLTAAEVNRIADEVRKVVREKFTPMPVDLPSDFPFTAFKALVSGSSQTIALPIQLSGGSLSATHLTSINNPFIDSSGFAFAVSKEFVGSLLNELSESIKASLGKFKKIINRTLAVCYTAKVTAGPSLKWKSGAIEFSIGIRLVGHNSPLNFDITVDQEFTLKLKAATQAVTIKPVGDPQVTGAGLTDDIFVYFLRGEIVSAIKLARDNALEEGPASVNDLVQDTFLNARDKLVHGLRTFDSATTATFTAVEITTHGVIVRGEIGGGARQPPVVQISETDDGTAFSALQSWIPGGRIEKLTWTWVEQPSQGKGSLWSGVTKTSKDQNPLRDEKHRFILPKPAGITDLGSICLRIEGTQTTPDGRVVIVDSGETCQLRDPFGPLLDFPSWWENLTVPLWLPDSKDDTVLKHHIAGHISVVGDSSRKKGELTHNSLMCFADWRAGKPLEPLARALAAMKRQKVSLVVIVVLPAGAFDCRRSEAEARLEGIAERFGARLLVTEDHDGAWARTFAAVQTPSIHLIDAQGKLTWRHEGEADPEALAAALDEHLLPAPMPRSRPLRLAASHCHCHGAPDVVSDDHEEEPFALHRLRGRKVILNFWQAWSAPCIKELIRLQGLAKQGGKNAPSIVAFHGGKERKVIDEIREKHGLTFPLLHDTYHRIARQYGVRCWPTTISINADGQVGHVQFGAAHEHAPLGENL